MSQPESVQRDLESETSFDYVDVMQIVQIPERSRPTGNKLNADHQHVAGIHLVEDAGGRTRILAMLHRLKLLDYIHTYQLSGQCCIFLLKEQYARQFLPKANTLDFDKTLNHALRECIGSVEGEIVLTMLGAPQPLVFSNFDEFLSAVRTRVRIVESAQRTRLAFGTSTAERPEQYWTYSEEAGYTLIPGQSLITALEKATQPANADAPLYAFSCYRATEYVLLHAITQELALVNPNLLRQLQRLWEVRPIKSGEYHDVFLDEYGSIDNPLPTRFYVPGDRVWFRNPDPESANVSGYEGSWVIYLGGGLFSNFWKQDQPYTFEDKCLEIYHWRDAIYIDHEGEPRIDETIVEQRVQATRADPERLVTILQQMAKPRDGRDIFADGGCADVSREYPKPMCVGTGTMKVPICNEKAE